MPDPYAGLAFIDPPPPVPTVLYVGAAGKVWGAEVGGAASYTFAAKALPPGMTVVTYYNEGVIEGTPTKAGSYTVTLVATDEATGVNADEKIAIRVYGSAVPAELTSVEEPGQSPRGASFGVEGEKKGVIWGQTSVIEGGLFTYDVKTERLRIYPANGAGGIGAEYWSICEPAKLTCTGTGPLGATTFR